MKNLIIILSLFVASCGGNNLKESSKVDNSKALAAVQKEPKVKEAIITDAKVIYVSVEDDQTNRSGYAEYICQLVKEHQGKVKRVKIIKHNSASDPNRDNAYGVLLGESNCE